LRGTAFILYDEATLFPSDGLVGDRRTVYLATAVRGLSERFRMQSRLFIV
jgi:hypothetical protein